MTALPALVLLMARALLAAPRPRTARFAVLVLLAVIIAVPLAYLAAERWLEGFAYRIGLGPSLFLLAGSLALAIALLTVSAHTLRAATSDPDKALRTE